ncbi:MAG: hypothetical protein R2774_04700 [Saprospiraceae bacterium]
MKYFCSLILVLLLSNAVFTQEIGLKLSIESIDYKNKIVCYNLGIINLDDSEINLAGQNFRIFYDTGELTFNVDSTMSLLPLGSYTPLVYVNILENVDASGKGSLNFEDDLGFLNFYIDLNDVANGGVKIQPDSTFNVAKLCFIVKDTSADFQCHDILLAAENLTDSYAFVFNEVSLWNGPNSTSGAQIVSLNHIFSSDFNNCVDFIENTIDVCTDGQDNDGDGDIDCDDIDCKRPSITNIN